MLHRQVRGKKLLGKWIHLGHFLDDLFGLCDSGKVFAFSTKTHPSRRVGLLETESNIGKRKALFFFG